MNRHSLSYLCHNKRHRSHNTQIANKDYIPV